MERSKSFALMFLILAFIAGIAVGVTGDRALSRERHDRRGPRSGLDRMSRELGLNATQRAQVDSIMARRRAQMKEVFKPLHPQIDSLQKIAKQISDSTHEQIKRVLTPEQGRKFDQMRDRARKEAADMRARRDAPHDKPSPLP
jgi:Spy/CpxP family protein refolding chaperone